MRLATTLLGRTHTFRDLREVLAKANEPKSGDVLAGVAAEDERERVAAKLVLAEVTLKELREHPAIPYEEDEVTRVVEDALDDALFQRIASWRVGQLREWLLDDETTGEDIRRLSPAITPEIAAACAKLMSNLDLIVASKKVRITARANGTFGLEGRFSSRLQPNDPLDSVEAILAVTREGLAYGNGDAVIGINPATDSVERCYELLSATKDLMRRHDVPTQNCVLAHVTIQMQALERGAPMDLMFQSIAGSQKANRGFGVDVKLLDEAAAMVRELGTAQGPNRMYFETGQGSALSADAHFGCDQLTIEARAYGLARRYQPYILNTVVGFIGPEYLFDGPQITRAGLEDHFCGKLLGISMGCDVCYTNHARTDQNQLENLAVLLASAGCNYFMGLPLGDDVMLNYESSSFHDNAAIRDLLGLRPTPEFEAWMEAKGLTKDGRRTRRFGDASLFA
ncbi:MAG: ethanolamine ammonia-lyase subunit EutB [Planctomycetota bacterium]|nr:ethanolamine ammonia-lyase subunit EutB [Planctomycetota bacterium]